jgi:hypothetical protein
MHHRKTGTAEKGPIRAAFTQGVMDHAMGNHPVWELFRIFYQMTKKPFMVRGMALGAGYLWTSMRRADRAVSRELMDFHRREEMHRLAEILKAKVLFGCYSGTPGETAHKSG